MRALPVDLGPVSTAEEFLARSHRAYPVMRDGAVIGLPPAGGFRYESGGRS